MIINVLVYVVELDVLLFEPKMRLIFHFQRIVRYDLLARLDHLLPLDLDCCRVIVPSPGRAGYTGTYYDHCTDFIHMFHEIL